MRRPLRSGSERSTDLERQRHLRHLASAAALEDIFWVALIVGAILTVGFSYFFHMDDLTAQAVVPGLMTALMALLLALGVSGWGFSRLAGLHFLAFAILMLARLTSLLAERA